MSTILPKKPMNLKNALEIALSKDFDSDRLIDHIPQRMLLCARHLRNVDGYFGILGAEARMLMLQSRMNILDPSIFFEIFKLVDHINITMNIFGDCCDRDDLRRMVAKKAEKWLAEKDMTGVAD